MDINLEKLTCHSSIISLAEFAELKNKWLALEEAVNPTIFLSWSWIFTWASMEQQSNGQFCLIEAIDNKRTVGLGLFKIKSDSVFPFGKLNQLWLHRHGEDSCDQIWIEHNDILAAADHCQKIRQSIFEHLLGAHSSWQEIYIGMSDAVTLRSHSFKQIKRRTIIDSPAYRAELANHLDLPSYLSSLSKNTRAQISKSTRNLTIHGDIKLELAIGLSKKQEFLKQIAQSHIERWGETDHGSGFSNPSFVDFHHTLLMQDENNQYSRLYQLSQNGKSLGLVYLLTTKHTWYFYLSAITFHSDPKVKVGMLLHTLLMEQAIKEGVQIYDFMAGEAQYKKSLANCPEYSQQLVCFYRPTPFIIVREQLRKLKAWFNKNLK